METDSNKNIKVKYIRDTSGKALSMAQGSNTYYYLYNAHGDVTGLTNSSGTVVSTYTYDEFGNLTSSTGSIYNPIRYSGANNAYFDEETSLYKMGSRYYMPEVGRWITRDEYRGNYEDPASRNQYVYCKNNPVTEVDSDGFMSFSKALSYSRTGDILATKNKWLGAMPGYYTHVAIDVGKINNRRYYGESNKGSNTNLTRFSVLKRNTAINRVAILRVKTSNTEKSNTVKYAKWLARQNIPYRIWSDVRYKSDGMNCTEYTWRSFWVGTKHRIDYRTRTVKNYPSFNTPSGRGYNILYPDDIRFRSVNRLVAFGRR